jgi:branched-chain amino acid transport system permease protein
VLQGAIIGIFTSGGAYAVFAICLIILFRTTGVVNFAICATGMIGTLVLSVLVGDGSSMGVALVVALLVGAGLSVASGLILTRLFFEASVAHRAAVAIALLIGTLSVALWVFGPAPRALPEPVGGSSVTLGGVAIAPSEIVTLAGAGVFAVVMGLAWGRTTLGCRLRAIAAAPTSCELLGLPVKALSLALWAATGVVATITMVLLAPHRTSDPSELSLIVVPSLAAALLGRFRSFSAAALGGMLLGVLEGVLDEYQSLTAYQEIIPFAIIVCFLLWTERKERWDAAR